MTKVLPELSSDVINCVMNVSYSLKLHYSAPESAATMKLTNVMINSRAKTTTAGHISPAIAVVIY